MTDKILNAGIHAHLLDLGFIHTHNEADWFDGGDAENGPKLEGGPEYDCYDDNIGFRLYVSHRGEVLEAEPYDKAMEDEMAAFYAQYDEQDQVEAH